MWEFASGAPPARWTAVDSPVPDTYHDVAATSQGPCAVATGGAVVARATGGTWGVVVEDGPSARGETLRAVDATSDGERVWFVGANGALGWYDLPTGRRVDRSEPRGITDGFGALAVEGERGSEKLLVADGSGHVFPAEVSGRTLDWGPTTVPSGDTAVTALAAADGVGFAVDSNAAVYRTTGTDGWERIGVEGAGNSLYAVAASPDCLLVGGGNGRVYGGPPDGSAWTPHTLGDFTVRTLAAGGSAADDSTADPPSLAAGTGGSLYARGGAGWRRERWDGSKTIRGVASGDPTVAVGSNGLILERTAASESNRASGASESN
ncbi:hypothetical protein [Halosimplex pelagicum]|uniref:WD40 repeat domain-containing protein n=1 Tax=Halosimplex pelagicum TaxID=869886 RepID=A0A7D5TU16_9EURY|nr:hypothetical protein [Halosimplex pelagicum]QLH81954.1 hypothetical protein HZS54_10075 [Halosimplex pelagicum]